MMLLAVYGVASVFLLCACLIMALMPRHYRKGLAGLNIAAALAALGIAGLTSGIYFNHDGYFGDFWTATEALNKASDGFLSSVDYFNPIGPVYSYVYGLAVMINPTPTASTVMHAGAIAAALSSLMAIGMLWKRLSFLGLTIVLVSVVTVAVSGRGNGELLKDTAMHFLAPYNRWAWALFIPVAVRLSLPNNGRAFFGVIILGFAIAMLLLTKVTYGSAALGLIVARVILLPGTWRELPGILGALGITLAAIEITTGQVTAHLNDLALTASLDLSGLRIPKLFSQLGEMVLFSVVAIIAYLV
ncbi:unnamed protein product, partial [Ectocarpus sp. 12 AP-2014]